MRAIFFLTMLLFALDGPAGAQVALPSPAFSLLQWRCIGPHRGGRTVGATGVRQQPGTFYIGVNNGGVWKTTDYGRVWTPVFDDQPTGSIGDVAVAPGDPNVIYVASGEGLQRPDLSVGNGVYRSSDGGKTWTNTGLREGLQIGGLAVDPTDPNRVFAAVLGHPYGPNPERGVYRTKNGGKTWEKVKYIDENTGAIQVTIDPADPRVVYADFWAARLAPWENGVFQGPGSGLWKSTDGGDTWTQLKNGLPTPAQDLGRIGFCICPSLPSRLYATVDCGEGTENARLYSGIYRSDDTGANWYRVNPDGGYCSSECTSDAACGPWTHCVSMVGTGKKYCLASCDNATTCRKPGYACRYYGGDGVCYPDSIYDCSPKVATCTEKGTGKPGGCVREAYEDKGTCAASCTAGTGTCASVGTIKRQCVYWDATKATTGDLWKGLICMRSPATPVAAGGACNYVNECTDGYQCDGPFGLCRQLCNKTGAPTCTAGTCTDVFGTSTTPGLCR